MLKRHADSERARRTDGCQHRDRDGGGLGHGDVVSSRPGRAAARRRRRPAGSSGSMQRGWSPAWPPPTAARRGGEPGYEDDQPVNASPALPEAEDDQCHAEGKPRHVARTDHFADTAAMAALYCRPLVRVTSTGRYGPLSVTVRWGCGLGAAAVAIVWSGRRTGGRRRARRARSLRTTSTTALMQERGAERDQEASPRPVLERGAAQAAEEVGIASPDDRGASGGHDEALALIADDPAGHGHGCAATGNEPAQDDQAHPVAGRASAWPRRAGAARARRKEPALSARARTGAR